MVKATKTKKTKTEAETGSGANALDRAIAQIEKQYGTGSIMQMDESMYAKIEGIATGSLSSIFNFVWVSVKLLIYFDFLLFLSYFHRWIEF